MNAADRDRIRNLVDQAKRGRLTRSRLNRDTALDHAAYALFTATGQPDRMWERLSEAEREGWRTCVRVTVAAYIGDDAA